MIATDEVVLVYRFTAYVENLSKNPDETIDGFTLYHNAAVKPTPVRMRYVDIFVCDIHPARKGDFAVHDDDFSVVAVIVDNRYHGYEFIELPRVYTLFAEFAIKPRSDFGNAAYVVVYEIYL